MNTPSVDAEGVFFASGHTHRPAPVLHGAGGQALPRACERDSTSAVRAIRVVLRSPIVPARACLVAFCGAKRAGILQVATRKKIPPKY